MLSQGNYSRWDGRLEVIRKQLSVKMAHDYNLDVNSHSFPGDLVWIWWAVDA